MSNHRMSKAAHRIAAASGEQSVPVASRTEQSMPHNASGIQHRYPGYACIRNDSLLSVQRHAGEAPARGLGLAWIQSNQSVSHKEATVAWSHRAKGFLLVR